MEKVSGTWSRIMGEVCCRCLTKKDYNGCCRNKEDDDFAEDEFSDDLFLELSPEAQRKEFAEAQRTLRKVADSLKDEHNEFIDLRRYYKNRLELKVEAMRYHLYCAGAIEGHDSDFKKHYTGLKQNLALLKRDDPRDEQKREKYEKAAWQVLH